MEGQTLVSRPQNQRLQVSQAKAVTQPQDSMQPGLEAHRIWGAERGNGLGFVKLRLLPQPHGHL